MKWFYDFIGGRKMALVYCGVGAITYLAVTGRVSGADAVQWIAILAGTGAGAVAYEDGKRK